MCVYITQSHKKSWQLQKAEWAKPKIFQDSTWENKWKLLLTLRGAGAEKIKIRKSHNLSTVYNIAITIFTTTISWLVIGWLIGASWNFLLTERENPVSPFSSCIIRRKSNKDVIRFYAKIIKQLRKGNLEKVWIPRTQYPPGGEDVNLRHALDMYEQSLGRTERSKFKFAWNSDWWGRPWPRHLPERYFYKQLIQRFFTISFEERSCIIFYSVLFYALTLLVSMAYYLLSYFRLKLNKMQHKQNFKPR